MRKIHTFAPRKYLQPKTLRLGVSFIDPGEAGLDYTQIMTWNSPGRMLVMVCSARPNEIAEYIRATLGTIPNVAVLLRRHPAGGEGAYSSDLKPQVTLQRCRKFWS